ncbi:MAG TPA: hypothetical protein VLS93_16230, partial [Anaeromyxobacteraceae bacterium]|nr:hypothetical protein [Anaeromyxobacteraceae bacterium]
RFKSEADMVPIWTATGLDSTKLAYVHCRTGMISSAMYVALDAYLGWPVANYDGSWSQWGQLSANSANGGQLAADSPWRADLPGLSEVVAYNHASRPVELLSLDGAACSGTLGTAGELSYSPAGCTLTAPDSYASGNEIEEADALYMVQ